jgi:hypothetical protein
VTVRRGAAALLPALFLAGCIAPAPKGGAVRPASRPAAKAPSPSGVFTPAQTPAVRDAAPAEEAVGDGQPAVLAPLGNINDFNLLANGGFDPGWRVGYDTLWVVQLPPAPAGKWARAFLGAKLGRAKQEPVPGRPSWEKRRIKGEIDISVAEEPLWPHSRRMLLAETRQIPLEGDPDNPLEGVGEARWFWVEVPLKNVSFDRPNFVVLYSPSESLKGLDRAPVLAAGSKTMMRKDVNVWMKSGAAGEPPIGAVDALKTPVNTYAPAVAIKLVPEGTRAPQVALARAPSDGDTVRNPFLLSASVTGTDVSRAWVEVSTDTRKWSSFGSSVDTAPYAFTVRPALLPAGEVWLRVSANDAWENRGASEPLRVVVPGRKK